MLRGSCPRSLPAPAATTLVLLLRRRRLFQFIIIWLTEMLRVPSVLLNDYCYTYLDEQFVLSRVVDIGCDRREADGLVEDGSDLWACEH